ncbi:MAG: type II toxin-antitoxin system PemK/MazF family toxin [Pirellulaceae bacterium]|jgi:mRNA interferase MazF|nr:type II toxin-antitoxin system PemK/MazF family toxin [Pirellulaceae bacterium]
MREPGRGEVWLVDLGLAAKIRPCLVVSVSVLGPNDRALVTLVAHTTSPRGSSYEVAIPVRFLKPGVFDAQNLVTIPQAKLVRRLGGLSAEHLAQVENAIRRWLGL